VCSLNPLKPAQTVCSPRCRAARWRLREKDQRQARNREIRGLLLTARESIEAARTKLEDA